MQSRTSEIGALVRARHIAMIAAFALAGTLLGGFVNQRENWSTIADTFPNGPAACQRTCRRGGARRNTMPT